jgi:hypothetical protein
MLSIVFARGFDPSRNSERPVGDMPTAAATARSEVCAIAVSSDWIDAVPLPGAVEVAPLSDVPPSRRTFGAAADDKRQALAAATAMMEASAAVRGVVIAAPQQQERKQDTARPLTLAQEVARMFDLEKSAYPAVNDHVRQARRYVDAAVEILGPPAHVGGFHAGPDDVSGSPNGPAEPRR